MRLSTLCAAALLAVGSIGLANATPSITNGDFSQNTSPNGGIPTQFGGSVRTGYDGSGYGCTYGGNFITGWSGNGGYEIWYPSATAASTVTSCNQYNGATTQRLPSGVTAPPVVSGTFVGLDGQAGIPGGISQTINGLTAGAKYIVSFYWASTQEMSRTGATQEYLGVSLGNQTFNTTTNNTPSQGFVDWAHVSMTFTAGSTSELLSFLSYGQPGLPPFALLTGITLSQTNVPEPPVLALFGSGLLGLGLLTVFARRRALREKHDLA